MGEETEVDIKAVRDNIEELSAAAAEDDKVLLSGKKEFQQCKAEAEEEVSRSQVVKSETKELKDKIKKAEGLLRTESSKVEEQTMMLEEKQRTGDVAIASAEMECRE